MSSENINKKSSFKAKAGDASNASASGSKTNSKLSSTEVVVPLLTFSGSTTNFSSHWSKSIQTYMETKFSEDGQFITNYGKPFQRVRIVYLFVHLSQK